MPNWMKALLAMGAGTAAFGVVALVIFLIVFPPIFRDMEPRYQVRVMEFLPFATYWKEPLPFTQLPTLEGASDSGAAQQLLLGEGEDAATPPPAVDDPLAPDTGDAAPPAAPAPGLSSGDGLTGDDGLAPAPAESATPIPTITPLVDEEGGIPVGAVPTLTPSPLPMFVQPSATPAPSWTPVPAVAWAPAAQAPAAQSVAAAQPVAVNLPRRVKLDNVRYELQGWNNCGPTTMTMALSYYGWSQDQYVAARWMKPDEEDKNVSPWQMVRFVNDQQILDVRALYRVGGNMTLLKSLLAAGFPVVVEKSIQPADDGWMGHYVLLIGYDEDAQHFLSYDSYLGHGSLQGLPIPYNPFDEAWRHFNRVFMVVYPPSREMDLREVLGQYVSPQYGYQQALALARQDANRDRGDKWAWFNMGSSYVALGEYQNAAIAYDEAIKIGLPFRMMWYQFGPFEAFYQVGRYQDVRALAYVTIENATYIEEAYYWRGMAFAAEGQSGEAIQQFDRALYYNRNFYPAQEAKSLVEAGQFTVSAAP